MIKKENVITKFNEVLASELEDELIMVSLENNKYFGLDSIGRTIWGMLDTPLTVEKLTELLTEQYDVSKEQCFTDVLPFLEKLSEEKLISIA